MIIYKVTNIVNNKVYIGKTKRSLKERKREHLRDMHKCKYYFYNALNKYGEENFIWEVIDKALTPKELNEKEKYWIDYYKSYDDKFGYNSTLGGEATWFDNHKYTNEQRDDLSLANGGRWFLIYNIKGEFIGRYLNINRYCKENKITTSHFHICLNHKRVSVKGLIPIYEDEFTEELLLDKISKYQPKNNNEFEVFKDDVLIGRYSIKKEVANLLKIPQSKITDCLNGRLKYYKEYTFKYI